MKQEKTKKYLVACKLGGIIETYIIEIDNDYVPESDNMQKIKEIIIKDYAPHWYSEYAAPSNCGGHICIAEGDAVKTNNLNILAISNLQI